MFVTIPSENMLEFNLTNEKLILFSAKAPQVKHLIDTFINEIKKVQHAHAHAGVILSSFWNHEAGLEKVESFFHQIYKHVSLNKCRLFVTVG